jgi:hypothetical protein
MCPACLTSLALTAAATTGAGAAVTAFVVRVRRSLTRKPQPDTQSREPGHDPAETSR